MASELLKGLFNKDEKESRDRLKSGFKDALTVGALGYGGYKGFQGSNIVQEVSSKARSLRATDSGEFNRVGSSLRRDSMALQELQSAAKTQALADFKSDLQIRGVLESSEVSIEDKRALLGSLYDSLKELGSSDLKEIIKTGYNTGNLTTEQIGRLESSYNSYIASNDKFLSKFRRKFAQLDKIKTTLSGRDSSTILNLERQVKMEEFSGLGDLRLAATLRDMGADVDEVRTRYANYVKMAGGADNVSLLGFEDNADKTGIKNLYLRVGSEDSSVKVPLYLSRDRNGMVVVRATENLSTRYIAPQRVLNAPEIFNNIDLTSARGGNLYSGKGSYSYEEYIFQRVSKGFGGFGSLNNMSRRDIKNFYEFLRMPGLDAPRGMFTNFSEIKNERGVSLISKQFQENMQFARSVQSARFLIAGLEDFPGEMQQNLVKRLMQMYPEDVRGTGYPIITRVEDPFNRNKTLSFTDVTMARAEESAFNVMAPYGRIDEVINEQTARDFQMVGRYELGAGVVGVDKSYKFGKNRTIASVGSGGDLIGINKRASRVHGVNLGAIMLSSNVSQGLGLGEGMSYFGGTLEVKSSINQTVYDDGLTESKLFSTLKSRVGTKNPFLVIGEGGDYSVDQFFKEFGDRQGRAILGLSDEDVAAISRKKGIMSFTLGIVESSFESGRTRSHISGEMVQRLDRTKMFSTILKDTTFGITKAQMQQKLKQAGLSDSEISSFFNDLNVKHNQTLLTTTEQLKKGPQFISSQIAGSLELFGVSRNLYAAEMSKLIGKDEDYLKAINSMTGEAYTSLDSAGALGRKKAYMGASIQAVLNLAEREGLTEADVGRILGGAYDKSGKFLTTSEFETIVQQRLASGARLNSNKTMQEIKRGITFTAHYVSSGGVHTDYGRNLAKIEPRFMNYLYSSLRMNFGLDESSATRFLGSFLARQDNVGGRPEALLGMKLTSFSLSQMGNVDFENQIKGISSLKSLTRDEAQELIRLGADEAGVKNFLINRGGASGSILNLEELFTNQTDLKRILDITGGKSKIYLPGASTLENLEGFVVGKSGDNINIENEFTRYITDLNASISGMFDSSGNDVKFGYALSGFKAARGSIAKVSGYALRNALSGRISGSGTYMGQGIVFGKDAASSSLLPTLGGGEQSAIRQGLLDAFNQKRGYVLFQDSQSFLDSMTTFKEATARQLRFDKFANGNEVEIAAEIERRTTEAMRNFYFGMYDKEKKGIFATVQRNPNIYFAHFMPGMELMRYDFMEGENDPFLKLISANAPYNKTEFTDAGKEEIKKRKRSLQFQKLRDLYGGRFAFSSWDDFETARFSYYDEYRKLVEEKKQLQGIVGIRQLQMDSEGNPVKTPRTRTIRRFNKFTGRYSEIGPEVVTDKFNFTVLNETAGTSTFPAEREAYYRTRGEIFERIRGLRETREQARWGILGKPVETSPGSEEYEMITRKHTVSQTKLDEYRAELEILKTKLNVQEGEDGALTGRERSQAEGRVRTLTEKINNARPSGKLTKAGVALFDTTSTGRKRSILPSSLLFEHEKDLFGLRFALSNSYDDEASIDFNSRTGLIEEDYIVGRSRIEQAKRNLEEIKTRVRAQRKANKKAVELAIKTAQMVIRSDFDDTTGARTIDVVASDKFKSIFTGMGINGELGVNEPRIGRPLAELRRSYQGLIRRQRKKLNTLMKKVPKVNDASVGKEPFLLDPTDESRPSPIKYRQSLIEKDIKIAKEVLLSNDQGRIPLNSPLSSVSNLDHFSGQNDRFLFHLFSSFTTPSETRSLEIDEYKELRYKRVIESYNQHLLSENPNKPIYYDIQDFLIKTKRITPIGVLLLDADRNNSGEIRYFEGMEDAEKSEYIERGVKNLELSKKVLREKGTVPRLIYNIEGQEVFFDFGALTKRAKSERKLERHSRLQTGHFSKIEEILRGVLGLESVSETYGKGKPINVEGGVVYVKGKEGEEVVAGGPRFLVGRDPRYGEIQYTHRGITQGIISGALYNDLLDQVDDLEAQRAFISEESSLDKAYGQLGVSFGDLRLSLIGDDSARARTDIYKEIESNFDFIKNNLLSPRGAYSSHSGASFVEYIEGLVEIANNERTPGRGAQRKIAKLTRQLQGKDGEGGIVGRLARVNEEIEKHEAKRESLKEKELIIDTRKNSRSEILSRDFEPRFTEEMYSPRYAYEEKQAALLKKRESLLARRAELERLIQEQQVGRIDLNFMRSFESDASLRDSDFRPISDLRDSLRGNYGEALASFFGLNKSDEELANSGIRTVRDFIENSEYRRTAFRTEMDRRIAANEGSNALIEYVRLKGGDANGLMNFLSNNITYREINVDDGKGGTKTIKVMSHPEINAAQEELDTAHRENKELIERGRENRERIRNMEASQRAEREAALKVLDDEYEAARRIEEEKLAQLETGFANNPNRQEYEDAVTRLKEIKERREALRNSPLGTLLGEIKAGKQPLVDESGSAILDENGNQRFFNSQYKVSSEEDRAIRELVGNLEDQKFKYDTGELIHGKNNIFLALEALHGEEIKDLGTLKTLSDTRGSENISYTFGLKDNLETRTETVNEAIDRLLLRGLSKHLSQGDVGGGIVYFPQIDVKADLLKEGKKMYDAKGKLLQYESRMDFSRFSIGDFDADIYQIYHDTTNVMRERFKNNAESFHGLYRTGAEFLINMKELGRGMDVYGERMGASSLNIMDFRLDQYEKERILKSVGGLDVQIKVGMLGLAQAAVDEGGAGGEDAMRTYFNRLRAGASLVAVAQESLIIKAKHLQVAADVGVEFLSALKTSYSSGSGEAIFNFFDQNILKGTAYETGGNVTLGNIEFLNIPEGEASSSLRESLKNVQLNRDSLRETFDVMARTVKERGLHNLGSNSRLHKALEKGDAFSMRQVMSLLASSMEGGFSGNIEIDRIEEIMSAERNIRDKVAMNMEAMSKKGGGYLAAAAIGASYLAGVRMAPEALDAESKFSDMKARESIGGRHLYNMNHREHGNVAPSRFEEPMNTYDRPINLGETMVTKNSSMRMYGEAPTYSDAMMSARKVVGAGGNAFLGIQDNRLPISNSYITKSIRD